LEKINKDLNLKQMGLGRLGLAHDYGSCKGKRSKCPCKKTIMEAPIYKELLENISFFFFEKV
jgi:hypothetical protein